MDSSNNLKAQIGRAIFVCPYGFFACLDGLDGLDGSIQSSTTGWSERTGSIQSSLREGERGRERDRERERDRDRERERERERDRDRDRDRDGDSERERGTETERALDGAIQS
jgi:hypothetical protein